MTCIKCDLIDPPILFVTVTSLISGLCTVEYSQWANTSYLDRLGTIDYLYLFIHTVSITGLDVTDRLGWLVILISITGLYITIDCIAGLHIICQLGW